MKIPYDTGTFGKLVLPGVLALAFSVTLSLSVYSQKTIDIGGYLLDDADKPLKNGVVTPYYDPPLPSTTWEDLIVSFAPLDDGFFGLVGTWYPGRKMMVLIEDRPPGFYPLLDKSVLISKDVFKGIVISKYTKSIELQKSPEYVKYGQAVIDARTILPSVLEKILSHEVWVKIRGPKGNVLSYSSCPGAYNKESKSLVFYLPPGTWHLELVEEFTKKVVLPSTRVVIRPYEETKIEWR